MPAHNASTRAGQRKLREQMRGLGMSRAEIAAEMARQYKLRPRAAWRAAWGWTLEEAAERYNTLRAKDDTQALTSLTGSRLSEWENWPFSNRKPPITGLCLLAEIYHAGVLDLIDFHDRGKLPAAELLTLGKTAAAPSGSQPSRHQEPQRSAAHVGQPARDDPPTPATTGIGIPPITGNPAGSPARRRGTVLHVDDHEPLPAAIMTKPMRLRLKGLSAPQLDELTCLLDDQWHALVRTDSLLGPRHALVGVRAQLNVIDNLLREIRPPIRQRVLRLGAKYAESAAWLYEDSGDRPAASYWTGRSMEWAVEADDHQMVSWTLFRRSQQATAAGDAAQVAGLVEAAQREADGLPGPMLSAILQQKAHGYALERDENACHKTIDRAFMHAAAPDDRGDASNGHGSFCTAAYLEMQRGACWFRLGRPKKAIDSFDAAIRSMPHVYRRDLGVALSGRAAALAAVGEPEQAAAAASQALGIARDSGSGSILNMVIVLADGLVPDAHLESVAQLHAALAQMPGL